MALKVWGKVVLLTSLIVGIGSGTGLTAASRASTLPASSWDSGIAQAVSADVVASTSLPDGNQVYVFGDTMRVGSQVICSPKSCPFGFPHNSVAIEPAGSATFTMQSCSVFGCPYGWEWVPNWSDGTEFWMAAPAVYGNTLYVVGTRISTVGSSCSFGCSEGEYVATFAIGSGDALTYKGVTQLTGPAGSSGWGSAVPDASAGGWWLTGTRGTGKSGCAVDCKTMDVAFVPFSGILDSSAWTVTPDVLPSGEGWDLGSVTSLVPAPNGWAIFTKRNDFLGSYIEELASASITSGWVHAGRFPITPIKNCTMTYSAQAHPGDGAPAGKMLVSWANNGSASTGTCWYVARFAYLPLR
jgi:hypothetical protein